MTGKEIAKRRKIYIKKGFQKDFSIKFLILIAVEAVLAIAIFLYASRGTVTTGYSGAGVIVARSSDYFLPSLLLINLGVIAGTACIGFFLMVRLSHKLAGPLYRFEKTLEEVGRGDLTVRFNLRSGDELTFLGDRMNDFSSALEARLYDIKTKSDALNKAVKDLRSALGNDNAGPETAKGLAEEAEKRALDLREALNYFKARQG